MLWQSEVLKLYVHQHFLELCLSSSKIFGVVLVSAIFYFRRYDSVLSFRSCAVAPISPPKILTRVSDEDGAERFDGDGGVLMLLLLLLLLLALLRILCARRVHLLREHAAEKIFKKACCKSCAQ